MFNVVGELAFGIHPRLIFDTLMGVIGYVICGGSDGHPHGCHPMSDEVVSPLLELEVLKWNFDGDFDVVIATFGCNRQRSQSQ